MNQIRVESFELDHTKVKAPYVRKCAKYTGIKGDIIQKYDLRFTQPNKESMPTDAVHTLEHLLAVYMREELDEIIDISPMGCRTGFYMTTLGEKDNSVIKALISSLKKLETEEVPAATEMQCGNYQDHSLEKAKIYASKVLKGLRDMV